MAAASGAAYAWSSCRERARQATAPNWRVAGKSGTPRGLRVVQLRKFDSLQVFRGLAALGVAIQHTAMSTGFFVGNLPAWLNSIFAHGFLGVDFFFVLSGFIILSSHFDDEKSVASMRGYGIKRFVRIFPPYWPVSIALLISYLLLPNLSQGDRSGFSLLSSLLLLPDAQPPALSVAWTLIHEVLFYLIFCLFFISNRIFLIFVAAWVMAIGAFVWLGGAGGLSPFPARMLNPVNLEFVLGMGVAYLARVISNRFAMVWIFLGCTVFILLLFWSFAEQHRILFSLPFSALVLGVVLLERQGGLVMPRWLVLIGDASYSIYLIHNPLVSLTSRLVARLPGLASWGVGMIVGVASSLVVGVLYHLLMEKPLIRLFRQQFNRLDSR
jgi:peptidoglycan/LPS O-acetylase OafA/YrhL